MEKNFSKWHELKCRVHDAGVSAYCKQRDVWWVCMGQNIGFEQDGKGKNHERPVLILKVYNSHLFLGIPLTSKDRKGKYYFNIRYNGTVQSIAILSQVRAYSSHRLLNKMGVVPIDMFKDLQTKFARSILS